MGNARQDVNFERRFIEKTIAFSSERKNNDFEDSGDSKINYITIDQHLMISDFWSESGSRRDHRGLG